MQAPYLFYGTVGSTNALANALNGSAAVFEALLEVDTKYTKFADKEYDSISTEVKKWFKKLVVRPLSGPEVHWLIKYSEGGKGS